MKLSLPNKMSSSDQPEPPTPPADRKRRSDDERQSRRAALGGWSRSPRDRSHACWTPRHQRLPITLKTPTSSCLFRSRHAPTLATATARIGPPPPPPPPTPRRP